MASSNSSSSSPTAGDPPPQRTRSSSSSSLALELSQIEEWTPQVEKLAKENMERCREIVECQDKIRFYKARLSKLKAEQKRAESLTRLKLDACSFWPELSKKDKWKKETILAALQCPTLPDELEEDNWDESVPEKLKQDKDIFLARLQRPDFQDFYPPDQFSLVALEVPTCFLHDKTVMMQVLKRRPQVIRQGILTQEFLDDKDIFRAMTQESDMVDAYYITEDDLLQFSTRVRSDPDLMLACVERGIPCVHNKTFFSSTLRNDKDFAIAVAAKGASQIKLKSFSQRLRADLDVVLAHVKNNGHNLAHASFPLRRHARVIKMACKENPTAFSYALKSRAKSRLVGTKSFMLDIFRNSRCVDLRRIWNMLPSELKKDRDVAVEASISSYEVLDKIASQWLQDREFWKRLVQERPRSWYRLPVFFHHDRDLALLSARNVQMLDDELLSDIIYRMTHENIMADREVVLAVVESFPSSSWHPFLVKIPHEIMSDKEFVLRLCGMDGFVYEYVAFELKEDRDVVQEALVNAPEVLSYIPAFVQHLYPNLVAQAIRDSPAWDLGDVYDAVDEDLWANRDVALAWVSRGGGWLGEEFEDMEDDEELFLAVAEHSPEDFYFASYDLYSNKEYMIQVVKKHGTLIEEADGDLLDDYDLLLAAFAESRDLAHYSRSEHDSFSRITEFAKKVRERLGLYMSFMEFLGGVSLSSSAKAPLALLNQGQETAIAYKKLIAEYTGIPQSEELEQLRKVSANLARWGY